jgi:hypothetical protein
MASKRQSPADVIRSLRVTHLPREWFLVPLFVVNEAVERIKDGTITQFLYDPQAARLMKAQQ